MAAAILQDLAAAGELNANRDEIKIMAMTMTLIPTHWLSYEFARDLRALQNGAALASGPVHVLSLTPPHLEQKACALFDHLAQQFLS